MPIPETVLEEILNRVDIVELISGYLPLKKSGRNFKANCPFHHEKTPSFMVSVDKQIYHCFGCGESGNAFKFLMRHERVEFPEAVRILAQKSGVVLPLKDDQRTQASQTSQLHSITEEAALFYENTLNTPVGLKARKYLVDRGINEESIKQFRLGFASDKWDALINFFRAKSIDIGLLEKAGLVLSRDSGGYYDRFRNRIIFPIYEARSRVVGFGARCFLDVQKEQPKYVNSPESNIYSKGKNLYGLNFAKDRIRELDYAVIVEGYLDFIVPFQHGVGNIVASLGTALTEEQVRLLKRYTKNAVLVYDADSAGQSASLRSLDIFIDEGVDLKVATLNPGHDPDSFVRTYGVEKFRERINEALPFFDYKLAVLKTRYDHRKAEGKAAISNEMLFSIARFSNSVLKSEYGKKLAIELSVEESAVMQDLSKVRMDKPLDLPVKSVNKCNITPTEKLLIGLMFEESGIVNRVKESLNARDFGDEKVSKIVSLIFELVNEGKNTAISKIMNYFKDDETARLICESAFQQQIEPAAREKAVNDCIRRIKSDKLKLDRNCLHERIRLAQNAGDEEKLRDLMKEFHHLIKKGEA
jgi:DNA primase